MCKQSRGKGRNYESQERKSGPDKESEGLRICFKSDSVAINYFFNNTKLPVK